MSAPLKAASGHVEMYRAMSAATGKIQRFKLRQLATA